jgi:methyl-accepting chemotaxis protein
VEKHGYWLQEYQKANGFDDLLVIESSGNVVYTVAKRSDMGGNIHRGALKDSVLSRLLSKTKQDSVVIEDMSPYGPANDEPVVFIGVPVLKENRVVGMIVAILGIEHINTLVVGSDNMGEAIETFLTGHRDGQTSLRSSWRNNSWDTDLSLADSLIKKVVAGKPDSDIGIDLDGVVRLTVFAPLNIPGVNWSVLSRVKAEKAFALGPGGEDELDDFYTFYKKGYGYYDLFLINPNGSVYYSVAHESDYLTNLIDGSHARSSFGELIRQVTETKKFGMVDFDFYPPSGRSPAAFMAQPVVHSAA